ncbi:MAG: DUF131 domain-containing protein [Methanomassiliicoccales archaeon]|nr:DUF131 domain-containing protein [Methanomassiliicoccales archaeon]
MTAVAAVLLGEVKVGLLLFIIPYLYGDSLLGAMAILSMVAGVFLLMADALTFPLSQHSDEENAASSSSATDRRTRRRGGEYGGVLLIGPIPIAFGSSGRAVIVAMAIMAIVLIVLFLLFLLL